ncbi:MAG TPA: enoyl-CoA hydratase/isomerase family protein [Streptosporangiaceae bacterium]|nr:enoyl-CoA hydratase/isomerase family protein [Streptosporangiaceae bacterium]
MSLGGLEQYQHFSSMRFRRPRPRVLEVTLSSPGRLNAADATMHRHLADLWPEVDRDPETRVVVLRGEGKAFSAGGDLDFVHDVIHDVAVRAQAYREARDLVYNVINCSKPIVSAMHGVAVGAGLAVGLLADVSIVSPDVRLIDGHTRLGVAAGDHAAIIWPILVGMAKAKYYLLTCETLSGEEAERLGLVSLCVPEAELFDRATEVAERLAAASPSAIAHTKYALNNWLRMAGPTFDASLALEFLGFAGQDATEGLAAVREKRDPHFKDDPSQDRD